MRTSSNPACSKIPLHASICLSDLLTAHKLHRSAQITLTLPLNKLPIEADMASGSMLALPNVGAINGTPSMGRHPPVFSTRTSFVEEPVLEMYPDRTICSRMIILVYQCWVLQRLQGESEFAPDVLGEGDHEEKQWVYSVSASHA